MVRTKLFSNLYLAKFLGTSAVLFVQEYCLDIYRRNKNNLIIFFL